MRRKMTPTIAALIAFGWLVLGAAQLYLSREGPPRNRHFWLGIIGIVFAVLYGYRWKKLKEGR